MVVGVKMDARSEGALTRSKETLTWALLNLASTLNTQLDSMLAVYGGFCNLKQAFMKAWQAACAASGDVTLVILKTKYYLCPVKFTGPCKANTITVYQEGVLMSSTNLGMYTTGDDWLEFNKVNGLRLTGGGTLDSQGSASWGNADCPKEKSCDVLPVDLLNTVRATNRRPIQHL